MPNDEHGAGRGASGRPKAKTRAGHIELLSEEERERHPGRSLRIECYVLEDGRRMITNRGAVRALTGSDGPKKGDLLRYVERLPHSFTHLATDPAVEFERLEGGIAHGRDVRWFIRVCNAYIEARELGELHPKQLPIAAQAQKFVSAAAIVGVEALVDEACGYIPEGDDSVAARFIRELFRREPRKWDRFWPADIVGELCRVFRIRQTQAFPAPLMGVVGKLYEMRLGEQAHVELRRINPSGPDRSMHFQHFGDQLFDTLRGEFPALMTLLRMSRSKHQFWPLWKMHCGGPYQMNLGW